MINAQDIKNGTCIRMDGKLYFVIEFLHVKPGKGNTFMRTTLKDVVDGRVIERRFNIGEKLEDVRVERRPFQFVYKEGDDFIFMNQETYDQQPIAHDLINGVDFLLARGWRFKSSYPHQPCILFVTVSFPASNMRIWRNRQTR
jgi:elongation factor P